MANVFTFPQEKNLLFSLIPIIFVKSRQKKKDLFEKGVFIVVSISEMSNNIRIFSFCFINKIKNIEIANAFKKLKIVLQAYNKYDKMLNLTQCPTIQ